MEIIAKTILEAVDIFAMPFSSTKKCLIRNDF